MKRDDISSHFRFAAAAIVLPLVFSSPTLAGERPTRDEKNLAAQIISSIQDAETSYVLMKPSCVYGPAGRELRGIFEMDTTSGDPNIDFSEMTIVVLQGADEPRVVQLGPTFRGNRDLENFTPQVRELANRFLEDRALRLIEDEADQCRLSREAKLLSPPPRLG